MQPEPFLQLRHTEPVRLPLDHNQREDIQDLFAQELRTRKPFDPPGVSAGWFFNRDWTVVDTAFGCRYLVLADRQGGFILMSLRPDVTDVLVEFDRSASLDRPVPQDDGGKTVRRRNRQQYLAFLVLANDIVVEAEGQSE